METSTNTSTLSLIEKFKIVEQTAMILRITEVQKQL